MSENLHELFQTAAKFYFHRYKTNGGTLGKLSQQLGTSHTYISAVINGSRTASLELQDQIAKVLYGPYDKFIAAGRQIRCGLKPAVDNPDETQNDIEALIARLTHYVMQQKEVERQLQVNRQKYRDISLTINDVIFELNESMVFTYLAGRVFETMGHTREELLNKCPFEYLDAEEYARIQELIEESIKNNQIADCVINVRQNGELKQRHLIAKPVFNQKGQFKGFRGTCRDVTEKKRVEETIAELKWLFESIIDSVEQIALIITDKNGRVLKWNKHYQELLGYSDEVLETKSLHKYFHYLEYNLTDPAAFYKSIEEVKNSSVKTVHFFTLKDGRTIKRIVYPLHRNGILSGRITHLVDVTKLE